MTKKLLIIDDNAEITSIVSEALSDAFGHIICAHTVDKALFEIKDAKFDCIILDINLDGRNGAEVVKFIKDHPDNTNRDTPIIIASGIMTPQFTKNQSGHFAGILQKPFDPDQLHHLVEDILKKHNASS